MTMLNTLMMNVDPMNAVLLLIVFHRLRAHHIKLESRVDELEIIHDR